MLSKFTYKRLTWIDLESPTKEEVREVMDTYAIHPLAAEELLMESARQKADFYDNHIYLILHFPTVTHTHDGHTWQEVDFVLSKNFLLTVHYEAVDPLLEFSKMFEVNSVLEKSNMGEHAGYLFFYIMRELYKNLTSELNAISRTLRDTEERVFNGGEHQMVETISGINRKLINFRQAIRPHQDVLQSFETAAPGLFGEKFSFYAKAITDECRKLTNLLDGLKETLSDLWATNDSLLSSKTNKTMKTLAALAAILLPASMIASLFGISSDFIPYMKAPNAFMIVVGLMALVALVMFIISKWKKWL